MKHAHKHVHKKVKKNNALSAQVISLDNQAPKLEAKKRMFFTQGAVIILGLCFAVILASYSVYRSFIQNKVTSVSHTISIDEKFDTLTEQIKTFYGMEEKRAQYLFEQLEEMTTKLRALKQEITMIRDGLQHVLPKMTQQTLHAYSQLKYTILSGEPYRETLTLLIQSSSKLKDMQVNDMKILEAYADKGLPHKQNVLHMLSQTTAQAKDTTTQTFFEKILAWILTHITITPAAHINLVAAVQNDAYADIMALSKDTHPIIYAYGCIYNLLYYFEREIL